MRRAWGRALCSSDDAVPAHRRADGQAFRSRLVSDLANRTIRYAGENNLNYFTAEVTGSEAPGVYAVFFEVQRDKRRKRRLLLHIQSAYRLEQLNNRLAKGGKVRFATLLRKAYQAQ